MQQPGFQQRIIDESIQVAALGIQTRVKPGLAGLAAFLDVLANGVETIVKFTELRHPDIAGLTQQLGGLIDGVDGQHSREIFADDFDVPEVDRRLCAVGLIEHVLNVAVEPALLLEMRIERRQKRIEMRFRARIVRV